MFFLFIFYYIHSDILIFKQELIWSNTANTAVAYKKNHFTNDLTKRSRDILRIKDSCLHGCTNMFVWIFLQTGQLSCYSIDTLGILNATCSSHFKWRANFNRKKFKVRSKSQRRQFFLEVQNRLDHPFICW